MQSKSNGLRCHFCGALARYDVDGVVVCGRHIHKILMISQPEYEGAVVEYICTNSTANRENINQ